MVRGARRRELAPDSGERTRTVAKRRSFTATRPEFANQQRTSPLFRGV